MKNLRIIKSFLNKIDNERLREDFVKEQLNTLDSGIMLLDAGCGSQQYKKYCGNFQYFAQDFGQYDNDDKKILGGRTVGGSDGYKYGKLDYTGNIWQIDEKSDTFDCILCTEVLEHIPCPNETLREFHRLLKPGGRLILTAPSNCLRHMDPYYFYSGFSDRYYEHILTNLAFDNIKIVPNGGYYSWFSSEIWRHLRDFGIIRSIPLIPAFIYFLLKTETKESIDTLCFGYHVSAVKL